MKFLSFLLMACLSFPVTAAVFASAEHPNSKEIIFLMDTQGDCPLTSQGQSKEAGYLDPKDGETAAGCWVLVKEKGIYVVVLKEGTYAGQPMLIPEKMFKPAI